MPLSATKALKAALYCPVPLLDDTIITLFHLLVIGISVPILCQFHAMSIFQPNPSSKVSISSQKSTSLSGADHDRIERIVIACERSL